MTLYYEEGALTPRQNGKTHAAIRALKARVEDLLEQYGKQTEYRIVFIVGWKVGFTKTMLKGFLNKTEMSKVVVVNTEEFNKANNHIPFLYDVVIDTSILSVPNLKMQFKGK